jgi:hypothetical protein
MRAKNQAVSANTLPSHNTRAHHKEWLLKDKLNLNPWPFQLILGFKAAKDREKIGKLKKIQKYSFFFNF